MLMLLLVCGCHGFTRTMPAYPRSADTLTPETTAALSAAVDDFYTAHNTEGLDAAVQTATRLAPDAPQTHEIAGHLAQLRGDENGAWRHFYLALATAGNPFAALHLQDLLAISMTAAQYRETLALLEDMLANHPDEGLKRVLAAFIASWHRRLNGDALGSDQALAWRGGLGHASVIGVFDNHDGQGFNTEYPPEREVDFNKEYAGTLLPAQWRQDVPLDHQGNVNFLDLLSPGRDVVAYALSYVFVPTSAPYTIRITTSDPVKMWVNQFEVLSEQRVAGDAVDQFVVPVTLRNGWNSVLVKSCNDRGDWLLGVSVTTPEGALVPGLKSAAAPRPVLDGPQPGPGFTLASDIERRLSGVSERHRKQFYSIQLAVRAGNPIQAQDLAETYASAAPRSLMAKLELALTTWDAGQLGATIDILDALIAKNGRDAPQLFILRASYFDAQNRLEKARQDLLSALAANPDYRSARNDLATNYAKAQWREDHLKARQEDVAQWPDDTETLWGLAQAYEALGRQSKADAVYGRIRSHWRGASDILEKLAKRALHMRDFNRAVRYQNQLISLFESRPEYHLVLGDILRRAGRFDAAAQAYEQAKGIDDRWAKPVGRLADLAYEQGDRDTAVSLWKKSLVLDPDNHFLADRLEFIAPDNDTLFQSFIPQSEDIKRVLSSKRADSAQSGANVVAWLDHMVEQFEPDGSSRQVVTQILTAINDTGRDRLTNPPLPNGRIRIMEAYAVDVDGNRREASSIRGNDVRFRELKVGTTVVIQYRLDTYPAGYLSRYLTRRWFFHQPMWQFEDSHYVLLVPKDMPITEHGQGRYKREETVDGDTKILSYRAKHVPPFVIEPFSPKYWDLLEQINVSTIPDWDTIAQWDYALLADTLRASTKISDLAQSLTAKYPSKTEKLSAIARFVMQHIRYQQDYETTIAGVKPHAASIVLQRAYGDCKDKSVLLMTMAREVGIETRFALVRTAGAGAFIEALPSLQFNHAIVYVPAQEGIREPYFIDATPDTLDLATLRPDVQNILAMVVDPETGKWSFEPIPPVQAESQYTIRRIQMTPIVDEESEAAIRMTFQGPTAAAVRTMLRNQDDARVFAAGLASSLFSSARVEDLSFLGEDDIVRPVTLTLTVKTPNMTRAQGNEVVVALPKTEDLSKFISLSERRHPLQLGLILSLVETEEDVLLPQGYAVKYAPENIDLDTPFFSFQREVQREADRVRLKLRYLEKKRIISASEYPKFREAAAAVVESLRQDLILKPVRGRK